MTEQEIDQMVDETFVMDYDNGGKPGDPVFLFQKFPEMEIMSLATLSLSLRRRMASIERTGARRVSTGGQV